jgi:hypothetical protein
MGIIGGATDLWRVRAVSDVVSAGRQAFFVAYAEIKLATEIYDSLGPRGCRSRPLN